MLSLCRAVPCALTQANVDPKAGCPVLKKLATLALMQNSDKFKAAECTEKGDPHQHMKKFVNSLDKSVIVHVMKPVVDGTGNRLGSKTEFVTRRPRRRSRRPSTRTIAARTAVATCSWHGMAWHGMAWHGTN